MKVIKFFSDWTGYFLCEFSFRLYDKVQYKPVGWKYYIIDKVGSVSYRIGCWFYNVGD